MNKKKKNCVHNIWLALKNAATINRNVCMSLFMYVQSNWYTSEIDKKDYTQYGSTSKAQPIFKTAFQIINHSLEQVGMIIFAWLWVLYYQKM